MKWPHAWTLLTVMLAAAMLTACPAPAPTGVAQVVLSPRAGATPDANAVKTAQAEAFIVGAPTAAPPPAETARAEAFKVGAPAALPPTPTPVTQQASLREEMFLAGAPSFAITNRCVMPEKLGAGQHAATWTATLNLGQLCLFGFAENETVRYAVRDAAGELVTASEGVQDNLDGDALPSVKALLDISANAPGTWSVQASAASGSVRGEFPVAPVTEDGRPAVVLAFGGRAEAVAMGATLAVGGYGLPAGKRVLLGIYAVKGQDPPGRQLRLQKVTRLTADSHGAIAAKLAIDSHYAPGGYCAVLAADPAYEPTEALSAQGATRCFKVTK